MHVVPFPVRCFASSGTVIHWVPYQNWIYARWVCPLVDLWFDGDGAVDNNFDDDGDGVTGDGDKDDGKGRKCDGRRSRR